MRWCEVTQARVIWPYFVTLRIERTIKRLPNTNLFIVVN